MKTNVSYLTSLEATLKLLLINFHMFYSNSTLFILLKYINKRTNIHISDKKNYYYV